MYENCHILARGIDGDAVMHVFFSVQWCPLELSGHPHHLQSPLLSKFRVDWAQGALSAVRVLIPGCCKSIQRCKSAAMRCNSARVGPVAVKVPGPTTCTARRPRVRKLQDLSHQVQRRGQRQYPTNITYSITTRRPIPPPLTTHPSHPIAPPPPTTQTISSRCIMSYSITNPPPIPSPFHITPTPITDPPHHQPTLLPSHHLYQSVYSIQAQTGTMAATSKSGLWQALTCRCKSGWTTKCIMGIVYKPDFYPYKPGSQCIVGTAWKYKFHSWCKSGWYATCIMAQ
jgi:hypothetical protein